jgi:hypothetical protein
MLSAMLLLGFFLIITMQLAITIVALRNAPEKAAVVLLVPFYVYVYAKKEPKARRFLYAWYAGGAMIGCAVSLV